MDSPISERLSDKRIERQTLHDEHKSLVDRAEKASGADFDKTFAEAEAKESSIAACDEEIARLEKMVNMRAQSAQREADNGTVDTSSRPGLTRDEYKADLQSAIMTLDFKVPGVSAGRFPRAMTQAMGGDRDLAVKACYGLGQFYRACYFNNAKARTWCEDHGFSTKAQSEIDNPSGGFLVPTPLSAAIITIAEQFGVVRRLFRPEPMTSETLTIPRTAGLINAYWIVDGQTITPTTQTYDAVELIARKLAALIYRSSEVSEDAVVDLGEILGKRIGWMFAYKEDAAGIVGTGTSAYGKHLGVGPRLTTVFGTAGSSAGIHQGLTGSGSNWADYTLDDFIATMGLLPDIAWSMGQPAWVVSRQFYSGCMLNLLGAGGGNTIQTLMKGPFGEPEFLGCPVVFSQVMPNTPSATTIDALFGNFELAATFGDRRSLTLAQSFEYLFGSDQVALRGIERVGINVHDVGGHDPASQAINPANLQDNTTDYAGPVVGLLSYSN